MQFEERVEKLSVDIKSENQRMDEKKRQADPFRRISDHDAQTPIGAITRLLNQRPSSSFSGPK